MRNRCNECLTLTFNPFNVVSAGDGVSVLKCCQKAAEAMSFHDNFASVLKMLTIKKPLKSAA
jgi:hypothetical protein